MRTFGNVLWFIFGGFLSGLAWGLAGVIFCITIIGIPFGKQCFKFAKLSFSPFGKDVVFRGGSVSFLVNVAWFMSFGWWMAVMNYLFGLIWCVTVIGIPFGKQFFKLGKLSLAPFGAEVESL